MAFVNILGRRQIGRNFTGGVFISIILHENHFISILISYQFVSTVPINDEPQLVQKMTCRNSCCKICKNEIANNVLVIGFCLPFYLISHLISLSLYWMCYLWQHVYISSSTNIAYHCPKCNKRILSHAARIRCLVWHNLPCKMYINWQSRNCLHQG